MPEGHRTLTGKLLHRYFSAPLLPLPPEQNLSPLCHSVSNCAVISLSNSSTLHMETEAQRDSSHQGSAMLKTAIVSSTIVGSLWTIERASTLTVIAYCVITGSNYSVGKYPRMR